MARRSTRARARHPALASAAPGALASISAVIEQIARAPPRQVDDWSDAPSPGTVVGGRFELGRELGRGGFGIVFEARDRDLGRLVAFKAIRPGPRAQARFREQRLRREAEAAAQLQHPNVVTLFDAGHCDWGPFLVLELLRGETLSLRLARGPLPASEATRIAIEIARALAHAHRAGVLHRDLKPSNVFLTDEGAVKVLDFGLAHLFGTDSPTGVGTPGYMAPEQRRGAPEDTRTDVYAVGVLLHEMLTGARLPEAPGGEPAARLTMPAACPAALSNLIARSVSPDSAARPRSAGALLEGLRRAQRLLDARAARRRGAKGFAASHAGAESGQISVAVADFANQTGDSGLEGLSGMLITSLEQSSHLAVTTRSRMLDLLRQLGHDQVVRVDEPLAREIGRRAGIHALLLASIRRFGGVYAIELRALDPVRDTYLFTVEVKGSGKSAIPGMLDRLSRQTRRALHESASEVGASEFRVADTVTGSLEAYHHYFLGQQCASSPMYGQDCGAEFRRAVMLDPTFAAAHYELARWTHYFGGAREQQQAAVENALRYVDRAPPKEGMLIRAWTAHVAGRDEEALALYARIERQWPLDKQAFYEAGDLLLHQGDPAGAVPHLEKALSLDPLHGWALDHLVTALGVLGQRGRLEDWIRHWEATPNPAALHALSQAYGWLGDPEAAIAAARRGAALGGGLVAQEDLVAACLFAGRYADAEAECRPLAEPGSPVRRIGFYALAGLAAYQGRRREGLAILDRLAGEIPEVGGDGTYHAMRADYLLGDGDAEAVWREAEMLLSIDPEAAGEQAVGVAWLGDVDHAAVLARRLRPGSPLEGIYQALTAWHRGDHGAALSRLREFEERLPAVLWRVAPSFLHGELAARAGSDAEAVAALRRFQNLYLPRAMWRTWALPRSQILLAESLERLGKVDEARASLEVLLAACSAADSGDPLAARARVLRAHLSSGPLSPR